MKYALALLVFFYPHFISSKTISICGANFPPSTIVEDGRLASGYSIELIEEAFHRLQIGYSLQVLPWTRCLKQVQSNAIDMVIDTSVNNQPIITGKFAISYNQLAIYVRDDFHETNYSVDTIKGNLLGLPRGYTSYLKIAQNHDWDVFEAEDEENMFNMLKKGRFDYAFSDTLTAKKAALSVNASVRPLKPVVTSEAYYLGFSPDNEHLVEVFDQVLDEMVQDGTIDNIYLDYLPYSYTEIKNINAVFSPKND